jgi:O-antigen ligase
MLPHWSALRRIGSAGLAACGLLAILGSALYQLDDKFKGRVDRTLALAHESRTQQDFALAGRLPIWQTAVDMSLAHPLNGVGVRGFRFAYPGYAQANDPWLAKDDKGNVVGANHPHQVLLELSCETGLLGLFLVSFAAFTLIRAYWRAPLANQENARAYAWCLLALLFPLNTHAAFFSSFWALVLWWLVALMSASLNSQEPLEKPHD